ncbi:hypothetical protein [Nitrosomonas marina]|uniref:Mechanosensitive ion channel n=1 Tax=Nitrosomonas marina TaxID=917 RepID=A0A1H8E467_9PROT|nr:hypothetical protein [Nitrosomonas marina]SEN14235.1 hypothetical protein SAMN05216325_108118 [Nitrosomonas marina]
MKNATDTTTFSISRSILVLLLTSLCGAFYTVQACKAETSVQPQTGNDEVIQDRTGGYPLPERKPSIESSTTENLPTDESVFSKLNAIIDAISALEKELEAKSRLLTRANTETEKTTILNEIDEINRLIKEQENTFELIQTGGLDLAKIEDSDDKTFDWQKNLLEILQPIMNELHEYTEGKRKILELQNKIAFYQSQIDDSTKALKKMARINQDGLEDSALDRYLRVKKKWENLLEDSRHQLDAANIQLDGIRLLEQEEAVSFGDQLKQFVLGRGTTILMALLASLSVFLILSLLWKGILLLIIRKQNGRMSYVQRIANLIFRGITVLLSIVTVFIVLDMRDDQVLVAVTVLLLVIVVWALKNSVPRYIKELQTILDAGPVREGERILYNGVPMRIERLNFFSRLENPAMPGFKLRLPLSELNNYVSRPHTDDETWFPCKQGDFVLLADGRCLKVSSLTPEHVVLALGNGSMPQFYSIHDFLSACPKNLSSGFIITSTMGIDYQYQQESTTDIPKIFQEGILNRMQHEGYGQTIRDISVYFEQANSSSLDFKIIGTFDGAAAPDYYMIKRDLQRFAVDVCNQQQWTIPFNQLVVHQQ